MKLTAHDMAMKLRNKPENYNLQIAPEFVTLELDGKKKLISNRKKFDTVWKHNFPPHVTYRAKTSAQGKLGLWWYKEENSYLSILAKALESDIIRIRRPDRIQNDKLVRGILVQEADFNFIVMEKPYFQNYEEIYIAHESISPQEFGRFCNVLAALLETISAIFQSNDIRDFRILVEGLRASVDESGIWVLGDYISDMQLVFSEEMRKSVLPLFTSCTFDHASEDSSALLILKGVLNTDTKKENRQMTMARIDASLEVFRSIFGDGINLLRIINEKFILGLFEADSEGAGFDVVMEVVFSGKNQSEIIVKLACDGDEFSPTPLQEEQFQKVLNSNLLLFSIRVKCYGSGTALSFDRDWFETSEDSENEESAGAKRNIESEESMDIKRTREREDDDSE